MRPAWNLDWLTPARCRRVLAALLLVGFLAHVRYLLNDCPIDLAGDEAHYWDWSRQLDWSYYSKGPAVAYLIRASCAVFGDSMPAVRLPALLLAVGTSLVTYWLTAKLFASERIALGAVLLNHIIPMFVAGSVMMTIDPPFFFCWALASALAAKAIFDGKSWAWLAVGLAIGLGFLAKYAMFLWLVGLGVMLLIDAGTRAQLRRPMFWAGLLIALMGTVPVIVWNAQNGWVSLHHVTTQTGTGEGSSFTLRHIGEAIGGQVGALGPPMAVIVVGAVIYALRAKQDPRKREMNYLLCMGLPFWLIVVLTSLRTKVQVNWPAPAYFSLAILAAYFLATRLRSIKSWKPWRGWLYGAAVFGLVLTPIAHDTTLLYPLEARLTGHDPAGQADGARKWDPTRRLRGWAELGEAVSQRLAQMPAGSMVMAQRYDTASELAFYVAGRPKTYSIGSWLSDPNDRGRRSQFDMWADRSLEEAGLMGREAIYVGDAPPADLRKAFERMERVGKVDIVRRGLKINSFTLWRCWGFRGMRRPVDEGTY